MIGALSRLFGADKAVDAAGDAVGAVGNALDKLFTSDEEKAQGQAVLEKLRQQPHLLQAEINKMEAQHRSIFVAGWRPFIGWVAGASLAVYFIPQFALASFMWAKIVLASGEFVAFPVDAERLFELVITLLGLGGLRTIEKLSGKAK